MIRRDDRSNWLLIDQGEHANLAAAIARVWGNELFSSYSNVAALKSSHAKTRSAADGIPLHARVSIDYAIAHHDTGWTKWDWSPKVDPATGKPRDFMEMRAQDVAEIWTRSIQSCFRVPLAAYSVSRHFCYLAESVYRSENRDINEKHSAERFLEEQEDYQNRLRDTSPLEEEMIVHYGELGYRSVQFFDRLSLWLCCALRHKPEDFTTPTGEIVTLSLREVERGDWARLGFVLSRPNFRDHSVTMEPYPLSVPSLETRVVARRIPARRYIDDANLGAALADAPPVDLVWSFHPATSSTR